MAHLLTAARVAFAGKTASNIAIVGVSVTGCTVLASVVALPIATAALGAIGFTSSGVAAGSTAAAIQSSTYGAAVASGSLFALAQSLAAGGVAAANTVATVGTVAGGVVGAVGAGLALL